METSPYRSDTGHGSTSVVFATAPDLRLRFAHGSYAVALELVERAFRRGAGLALVLGSAGAGKTLLAADLMRLQELDGIPCARLALSSEGPVDLLQAAAAAFGLDVAGASGAAVRAQLVAYLASQQRAGRTATLVVDDAQHLEAQRLKELWQLGSPRSRPMPMLRLLLVGRPGLRDRMQQPLLMSVWQSVAAIGELNPLDAPQTRAYVAHRLRCVGWNGEPSLSGDALHCIHRLSLGLPGRINQILSALLEHAGEVAASGVVRGAEVERVAGLLEPPGMPAGAGHEIGAAVRGCPPLGPALRSLDAAAVAGSGLAFLPVFCSDSVTQARSVDSTSRRAVGPWPNQGFGLPALRRRLGLAAMAGIALGLAMIDAGSASSQSASDAISGVADVPASSAPRHPPLPQG